MDDNRAKRAVCKHEPDEEEDDDHFYLNNDDDDYDQDEDDYDEYMDDADDTDPSSQARHDQTPSVDILGHNSAGVQSSSYPSYNPNPMSTSNQLSKSLTKRQVELDDEFKYEILTPDKIVEYMAECIKDVNSVLELNPTVTRALLHHFRWDKEKLMERFYDSDQDRLFREAHVVNPARINKRVTSTQSRSGRSKDHCCEICFCQYSEDNMSGLECGHKFCKLCWREYLTTKIIDEGMGQLIKYSMSRKRGLAYFIASYSSYESEIHQSTFQ
ncbi:E3 ubiquitin- ligase arih1-like [Brachionus plicatilis]|uniref:E3 ubiquitin-ligase arih1-like n=1 Tax=Brachionus plicatilis TaxID=10195 RepID=A0A3M7RS57_BRAPC|nr:E3 ubiquitin- ligase arih1-like [Brachionus plicatilis]